MYCIVVFGIDNKPTHVVGSFYSKDKALYIAALFYPGQPVALIVQHAWSD